MRWSKPVASRAILQVAHGMGEHSLRYRDKLKPLMDAGVVVYANDHRGHGLTAPSAEHYGDFGALGFPGLVSDMARLSERARTENPGVPIVLMGHSMGSFAAQLYALLHSEDIDGLVISGSAALDQVVAVLPADPDASALDAFNGAFEPARTPFDWLSRDEAEVDDYIADPRCGFSVTPESMQSMVEALLPTADMEQVERIRQDLPVYFFSGDKDPVGGPDTAFLNVLIDRYQARGLRVTKDIYKDGRHEMLNETNRDEVVSNLRSFIESIVE
ncbi:MAG: alpha/beta fold hydrolase [Parvibaculum sp.]